MPDPPLGMEGLTHVPSSRDMKPSRKSRILVESSLSGNAPGSLHNLLPSAYPDDEAGNLGDSEESDSDAADASDSASVPGTSDARKCTKDEHTNRRIGQKDSDKGHPKPRCETKRSPQGTVGAASGDTGAPTWFGSPNGVLATKPPVPSPLSRSSTRSKTTSAGPTSSSTAAHSSAGPREREIEDMSADKSITEALRSSQEDPDSVVSLRQTGWTSGRFKPRRPSGT